MVLSWWGIGGLWRVGVHIPFAPDSHPVNVDQSILERGGFHLAHPREGTLKSCPKLCDEGTHGRWQIFIRGQLMIRH
jgi:hypothetical protein